MARFEAVPRWVSLAIVVVIASSCQSLTPSPFPSGAATTVPSIPAATAVPSQTPPPSRAPTPPVETPSPAETPVPLGTIEVSTHTIHAPISARTEATAVWTGQEVIVWGGTDYVAAAGTTIDGAAYDPLDDTWRPIADAPQARYEGHFAAWTGTEMLIWGGRRDASGAAYDPSTDTWRTIADSPFAFKFGGSAATWTGREWVVAATNREWTTRVAAYDPATDEWRSLPSLTVDTGEETGIVWAGDRLVLLEQGGTLHQLLSDAGDWVDIEPLPGGFPVASHLYWTGDHVLGVAHEFLGTEEPRYRPHLARWSPATGTWQSLVEAPDTRGHLLLWADGRAILVGTVALVYDPGAEEWSTLPLEGYEDRSEASIVWAGDRLFVWGGGHGGPSAIDDGLVAIPAW